MSTTKKIILIVLGVVIVGAIAFWYWNRPASIGTSTDNGGFSVRNFFPFGNADAATTTEENNGSGDTSNQTATSTNPLNNTNIVPIVKLRKLSEHSVAGAVIFNKATTSIIRFVEKATGNVYEARSDSSVVNRLTNETIPKISRAFWLHDGSGFLAQRLDDNENILTSSIKLKTSSTSTRGSIPFETVMSDLPTGIQEITVSPDSKKIFYYVNSDKALGYVSNPDGTSPSLVFSNYLLEWIPEWYSGTNISMATKASSRERSYGFVLNSANKTLTRTYNNIVGVSNLMAPDGKNIIIGSGGALSRFETSNSNTSSIVVATLPEKCVWNPADFKFIFCGVPRGVLQANYPDTWYQGTASTDDLIQKINVFDLYTYILSDPKQEAKANIDVSNIKASKEGNFLIFTNKKDSSLWMLDTR